MLRLLGLLGGLSSATDLGTGAPLEESVKRAVVAARLAGELGCPAEQVREVVYTGLLQHLGCTAFAHETAAWFGDDVAVTRAAFVTDWSHPSDLLRTFVPMVAAASGRSRISTLTALAAKGRRVEAAGPVATCEVATAAARRLDLPPGVQEGIAHTTCRWDGDGHPATSGSDIPLPTRITHVASVATLFCLRDGPARAQQEVRRRAGGELDPAIADALTDAHLADVTLLDGLAALLDCEPDPVLRVDGPRLERVLHTFGDLADLKSPWFHGHSAAVAVEASSAAARLGLGADEAATVRLAGHVHDLGRVGVSSRIWAKCGALSTAERSQVELHPWHTGTVLAGVPELAAVATLAQEHHERLDGSGYHRRAVANQLSPASRVLAAADRHRTLLEDRPHRPALAERDAAAVLRRDAAAGRLDPDAVAAVLASARPGQRGGASFAGLTPRQVAVLRLLASGRSNPQIAGELGISRRTAEHHVQDVYTRIGVSSRAAAALFAMEHGLLVEPG